MKLQILDLFSGIGGISLGLERTGGFETKAFCEIDKKAQQVLRKHWPDTPIYEDVSTLTGDTVGSVDIICGGFPCQDISKAGRGAGLAGERSGLWFQFQRLIKEIQPKYAIIENVSALRSNGLDQVLRGLTEIGYDAQWHCIPASAIGAPHRRDRIWIVAYPNSTVCGDGHSYEDFGDEGWKSSSEGGTLIQPANGAARSNNFEQGSQTLADTYCLAGEQQFRNEWRLLCQEDVAEEYNRNRGQGNGNWATEPDLGRVAHGVPRRLDRLRQLGNAVVPQIPELIGRAILQREQRPFGAFSFLCV